MNTYVHKVHSRSQGTHVFISETATRGFLGRIGQAMYPLIEELGSGPPTRRITGLGIAGFSVDTELPRISRAAGAS